MRLSFIFLAILIFSCAPKEEAQDYPEKDYHIVGYVAGWKNINPKKIPADKLTHINYAFADVKDGIVTHIDDRKAKDSTNLAALQSLKLINPDLKILISIGGWTRSKGFSDAVLTVEGIKKLTASGVEFLKKHQLDGLDFDWEYPGLPGDNNPYRAEDKDNFVAMLKSFRSALDSLGELDNKHYLMTIASGGFRKYLEVNNMAEAQKYLDFINIMAYDFYTAGDEITGHHANLYPNGSKGMSAQTAVNEHIEFGIPAEKLVLGVPFYGRMWKGVDSEDNGLFQAGNFEMGLPYHQIYALSKNSSYSRFWDTKASAPYLFSPLDSTWITFEDEESLKAKMKFVKENQLGGAMFWELSEDNTGTLLNTLYNSLNPADSK
ncbi:MAG TPA: glycoside hydrolase [Algoriphagus sp.]|jgi:chitinase|uniref:glycoside hydrolase family 18 protein n=1 Tax=unclassified Algoriphagus TaxID=2641541 RepID=UPI000C393069|nr:MULTISPECIES: glycoside hydrolase family 18 protein [unclassified Algoriphagus]MAL13955.1 glycoside hydrolase [Algoriphagus sp.]MAN87786.1 glycoside hydrolase [Algoriphagus sp.]HAD51542.1 glycoside hydrolase [Algoriphagus sp.]HAZ23579.1 glycoside hydrolase [Algoriphagus sp.]HCD86517.1 glycoside hydrolase [Algoriphagus sp.]|tara:strand:+ start:5075 stop:6205 length:1131 start_codon:yes stop_codon:yes gene_type:complete